MQRISIVCGAYGSGKTEFAIAYALNIHKTSQAKVGLIDLDIVNPYFRSRDVGVELGAAGLTIVSTEAGLEQADVPALSPRIYSLLQDKSYQVVFDVGGDPAGARALGRFHQYFLQEPYNFWLVVNPFRPDTRNLDQALRVLEGIQTASRLQANGIIANINLGRETTIELWQEGLPLITQIAEQFRLPIVYQMVEANFYQRYRSFLEGYPVFPVKMRMLPPWLREN